jgi:glycosyltransferase involved in cell wall biosynthesis
MRILVCTQHYEPEHQFGGTVTNAVAIAEGLARRGHQVTVLTSAPGSRNDETTAPSLTQQEWIDSVPKVERLPWEWAIGKARVCRAAPGHLAALVRNQDAVHIIGTYDFISPFITRLAHVYGVPFSMETCGMLPPSGKKLVLKWLFYRLYLQRMLKRAGAILVTSDQEHDDLFGMGFSRAVLIRRRNGVASQVVAGTDTRGQFRTRLGLDDQVPLILWLGRVEPVKQLEVLLLGLSILQNRPYHVAITGPGLWRSESPGAT